MENSFVKLIKSRAYLTFLKKLMLMSTPVFILGLIFKSEILLIVGGGTLAVVILFAIPAIIYKRKQMDSETDNDHSDNQQNAYR